ncbi:hypothetical protein GCM10009610_09910 [Pseudonocardia xinjiangensis]
MRDASGKGSIRTTHPPAEGRVMLAIIAAVLFALALIFELAGISLDIITAQVLLTAGLLCVALHLAGVGASTSGWRRSSRR